MPSYDGAGEHAFSAPDGTRLVYRSRGSGAPLVCLPGGPMQASAYLGDLGGLTARHRLILLDLRGTGGSATPEDRTSYRCDRLVGDVEALRIALGLDRIDLLAHSGGASLGLLYAARHPGRVRRLLLVTPGLASVAVPISVASRLAVAGLRSRETWFRAAFRALSRIGAGEGADEDWAAVVPFLYGHWDDDARAHHALGERQRNDSAAAAYGAADVFRPEQTRAALAGLEAPTLVVAGEYDVNTPPVAAAELAAIVPHAELAVLPRAGHYPWRDDPEAFAALASRFIGPAPAARMVR